MNKTIAIIFAILVSTSYSYSVDCKELSLGEARRIFYEESEIIFLGILLKANGEQGYFQIIEIFKGSDIKHEEIVMFDADKPDTLSIFHEWLIYGNRQSDGNIHISECSITRSSFDPFRSNIYKYPFPSVDDNVFINQLSIEKIMWRYDFLEEIRILRSFKNINQDISENVGYNMKLGLYHFLLSGIILIMVMLQIWRYKSSGNAPNQSPPP